MTGLVIRFIEQHGEIVRDYKTPYGFKTINEYWVVNNKRFDHQPSSQEIEEVYSGT